MSLFIQTHLPEAVLMENLSSELIYQLPDDAASVSKFEQLFVDLDSMKNELGISSYGISNTSLEEVWLAGCCIRHLHRLQMSVRLDVVHKVTNEKSRRTASD